MATENENISKSNNRRERRHDLEAMDACIRLCVPYVMIGSTPRPGVHCRNRLPLSRCIVVLADPERTSTITDHGAVKPRRIPVQPGRVYILPRDRELAFWWAPESDVVGVHFSLTTKLGIEIFASDAPCTDRSLARHMIKRVRRLAWAPGDPATWLALRSLFCGFIADALSNEVLDQVRLAEREVHIRALLGDEPPRADRGVAYHAARLGISPGAFAMRFRRSAGESAKAFLDRRLSFALVELFHTGASVTEAAHILSFSSPYQCSRFFKRMTGQSPKAFKSAYSSRPGFARPRMPRRFPPGSPDPVKMPAPGR